MLICILEYASSCQIWRGGERAGLRKRKAQSRGREEERCGSIWFYLFGERFQNVLFSREEEPKENTRMTLGAARVPRVNL